MSRQANSGKPANSTAKPTKPPLKSTLLLNALSAKGGASIETLCTATGWQAHSVRAALTGFRKNGASISRSRSADGKTLYAIATRKKSAS